MTMTAEPTAVTTHIQTAYGPTVEVPENAFITFVSPLLGFASLRRFAVYQSSAGPLYWLQSIDDPKTAFCMLDPFAAGLDPDYEITGADVTDIDAAGESDIAVYTLVVLDQDPHKTRTNLRAPILVGKRSRKAKQIVLNDTRLPLRHVLVPPPAQTT
jgi:flagellar assembly factor FliW